MAVSFTDFALTLLLALGAVLVGVAVVHVATLLLARRWPVAGDLSRGAATPFRLLTVVLVIAAV